MDFLQKPSAWFSNFYLRVKSKICGKNSFFLFFLSEIFRILSKILSDFWPKNFKNLWKLTSACPQEQLVALYFFSSFEPFWILCRNLWHGSQNSIHVSRVKFEEEIFFAILPFWIFSDFERKFFFRLLAKKLQEIIKTTFCVCRWTIFGLKKLLKVLNLFGFSAETFGKVLKILSTCPE